MKLLRQLIAMVMVCVLCVGMGCYALAVGTDTTYSVISGGMSHTLAVKSDRSVWAWGSNESGQLGQSSKVTEANVPMKIEGLVAVEVAAGYNFSAALQTDGIVCTWGGGSTTLTDVAGLSNVATISAGQTDLLALKDDGTVWQWSIGSTAAPRQVPGLQKIMAVSAGGGHFLALSITGQLWAWGRNDQGQLGLGDIKDRTVPVQISQLSDIIDITAGYSHSLAVAFDGKVYAWGSNTYGQLGNETTKSSTIPVEVKNLKDVKQVSAGIDTSIALTKAGTVCTWGYGEYGQLGANSAAISRTVPATIYSTGFSSPVLITSGLYHNLMVTSMGDIYAWGRNRNGQLGTGQNVNGNIPQRVTALSGGSSFSGGNYKVNNLQGLHSWSEAEIKAFYQTGMVSPRIWSDFDKNISRAEFAHLLVNVYEEVRHVTVTVSATTFQDVDGHPLKQDILKAYQLGFINGRSSTVFAPDDSISREEAVKMICTFLSKMQYIYIPTAVSSLLYYSDTATISTWAVPYVAFAHDNDIMNGSNGLFEPKGKLNREQSLLILARVVKHYGWHL